MNEKVKSRERRIIRKAYEKETKRISKIAELPEGFLNTRAEKWKKHTPTGYESEIEYSFINEEAEAIVIKYKDNNGNVSKEKYYGNDYTWKNGDHSFSLSTKNQKEHFKYMMEQLKIIKNVIMFILRGNITNSMNMDELKKYKCLTESTEEFNNDYGTTFAQVFFINIFPPHAFVYNKDTKTVKIATYYILGIEENKTIHIMFGFEPKFSIFHSGSRGLESQINEYNDKNEYKVTDIPQICENLAPIASTGYFGIGNCICKTSLEKINGPKKTEVVKYVESDIEMKQELLKLNK